MKGVRCFWAVIILFFLISDLHSQNNKAKLSDEKKQLEKSITELKGLLTTTQKKKNASLREVELLKNQITKQERLISIINEELTMLDNQIKVVHSELLTLNHKLAALKEEYTKAVYAAYKYRNIFNKSGFILSAKTISQAVMRMNYVQQYSQSLKQQLLEIQKTQTEIEARNNTLLKTKEEKTVLIHDRNQQKQNLDKQRTEKDAAVLQLKKEETKISSNLKRKIERQKQVDAAINKIIKEENARAKANAAKNTKAPATKPTTATTSKTSAATPQATPTLTMTPEQSNLAANFEANKGQLPWPVAKGTIINRFGSYSHPEVSSVKITNNGINILTEKGASIRSIFKGEVAGIIDINGSKSVLIRHGNYITVYSNLATVSVKKGDNVETKQIIGSVLTEASETHPELHFEIRKDASPLNPEAWIRQ